MALFIAGLALSERLFLAAKIGILTGSALCAVLGLALLLWLLRGQHNMVQQPPTHTAPNVPACISLGTVSLSVVGTLVI